MATRQLFVVRPAVRTGARLAVAAATVLATVAVFVPAAAAAAVPSNVRRISGADRIHTALAASFAEFPSAGSANAVVLARSDDFPDALAGAPLAAKVGAPLLLTPHDQLDSAVATEILRVAPEGSTVYVLGGTSAMSTTVTDAVTALGDVPHRLAGLDRFATAVAIADQMGDPTAVFEATGLNFPDALAAGPAAIASHAAILLTSGVHQAPATMAYLQAHRGGAHYALGGPAAAADPAAQAFIGIDRYDTAAQVADQFFPAPTTVGAATGTAFPDALSAGPLLAAQGAPLLLVPPAGALPAAPTLELLLDTASARSAIVFGGTAALSDYVAAQVGVLAGAGPAARSASASSAWLGQFGNRTDEYTKGSVSSTLAPTTEQRQFVVDGTAGTATLTIGGAPPRISSMAAPTRAELASLPLDVADLPKAVDLLFAKFALDQGVTSPDVDEPFVGYAEQVLLDPVASPSLRLAVFVTLASLDSAKVTSGVKDSLGRIGIEVSLALTSSDVSFTFDPSTFEPLEDSAYTTSGLLQARCTVKSMTTASSA